MALSFQVVVDCHGPHVLADWWAETLGWDVEPQDADFIGRVIAEGFATEADTTTHRGHLVWASGAAILHPDDPPGPGGRRMLFQAVPETKSVKNRLHLDLHVGQDHVDATTETLVSRGARFLHRGTQGPMFWDTLADPEGNEFCVH